jgi:hypothetical protein
MRYLGHLIVLQLITLVIFDEEYILCGIRAMPNTPFPRCFSMPCWVEPKWAEPSRSTPVAKG